MTETLRIGVLGCAAIAERRAIPAIGSHPHTVLTAVASRDPEKAKSFAARFGGVAATGYAELLERADVDAVYVPLPTSLHLPWGLAALQAGKHVLLEKPAAANADEARALVAEATQRRLVLRENFTFLHHSQHRAVAELIAAGRLGEVRSFTGAFCFPPLPAGDIRYSADLGGGALLDAGVYPIRATQLLIGGRLQVAGATLRIDAATGVDVAGQVLLAGANGVLADLQFGFEHAYGARYTVWGSTARLHLDRAFTPPATWTPTLRIEGQNHVEERTLPPDHQFENSIGSFAAAVLAGRVAGDGEDADQHADTVHMMELVDEIRRVAVRVPAADPGV